MTYRNRQSVRRIGRFGKMVKTQKHLHRALHLCLARPPVVCDSLFESGGRVLRGGHSRGRQGQQDDAPGLAQEQGAPSVDAEEYLFDRGLVRSISAYDFDQLLIQAEELAFDWIFAVGPNGPVIHERDPAALFSDNSVA